MKRSRKGLAFLSAFMLLLATLLGGLVVAMAGSEKPVELQSASGAGGEEAAIPAEGSPQASAAGGEEAAEACPEPAKADESGEAAEEENAEAEESRAMCWPPCPPQPRCGICVIKFLDLDEDGLKDGGECGMSGVTIRLDGADPRQTDLEGKVCYTDLAPGTYLVSETVPAGYHATTPTSYEIELCTHSDLQCWEPPSQGETVTVVFGNAPMPPEPKGSISGHKYEDLDGDGVRDPDEPPVPGITIELWKDGAKVAETVTGEDGSYSFQELETGAYTVKEKVPDDMEATSAVSAEVSLDPGEEVTGVDFLNRKKVCSDGIIEALVRIDTNCNGQFDEGDTPLDGVEVELFHIEKDGSLTPVVPPSQLTGPGWGWMVFIIKIPVYYNGGHVIWENLPRAYAGEPFAWYKLRLVVPEGYEAVGPTEYDLPLRNCPLPCFWYRKEFLLQNLFHISGHKYEDLDGDGVHDTGEPAVPGVTVELLKDGEKIAETVTGEDGGYLFEDLEDGVYEVREVLPDGWYPVSPPEGMYEGIEVGCGDSVEGLDFLNRRYLSISGHKWEDLDRDGTHDEGESPVTGVTIELWDGEVKAAETVTGEDGSYSFTGLLPGNYTVREVLPGGWFPVNPGDGSHDDLNLVYGQPLDDLDFHNCRYGTIEGVKFLDLDQDGVMDEDEEGLDGVTINLNGGAMTATTADGGLFSFTDLPPGTYVVAVEESTLPGYYPTGPVSIVVELEPGETERVYFGNAPYGSISGHKWLDEDFDGEWDEDETTLIPGITIELWLGSPPDELLETTVTGEDGSYAFLELEPGTYTVVEKGAEGYFSTTPDSVAEELSPGEGAVVDFGNCAYGRIQGLKFQDLDGDGVQDEGEVGLAGVSITLQGLEDTGAFAETVTGEDGTFSFDNLLPGDYAVSETVPAGHYATLPIRVEVSLEPGGTATTIFANAPYGSIVGSKWLDDGDSVLEPDQDDPGPGFTIKLTGETLGGEEVNMQTVTGEDGTFSFLLLEAGNYTVSEEFDPQKYAAISEKSVDVELAPGTEESVDFLNGEIVVGGEQVIPPTPPTPPAITGGTTALPATGMDQLPLLLAAAVLLLAGVIFLIAGMRRRYQE
ncbi:MAG: LPXTG cell wall anchor domain-containing protein [Actinobacteria bacterium]|nr:LPXTG cell wall anchor domain-containing protein [Actinomycetota bacterium]